MPPRMRPTHSTRKSVECSRAFMMTSRIQYTAQPRRRPTESTSAPTYVPMTAEARKPVRKSEPVCSLVSPCSAYRAWKWVPCSQSASVMTAYTSKYSRRNVPNPAPASLLAPALGVDDERGCKRLVTKQMEPSVARSL